MSKYLIRARAGCPQDQIFFTWSKPTSTGVSRPKMDTSTLSLAPSSLISEISPEKSDRGPETTLTDSPTENCARVRGRSAVSRLSRRSISPCESGARFSGAPSEPVPPGGPPVERAVDLALRERDRLLRRADEAGHAGRPLHERPRVLVEVHVHEHVAGHGAALGLNLLAVLHLGDVLGGDHDLAHVALLAQRDHAVLEVLLDLVLVSGIGVDGVPAKHSWWGPSRGLTESAWRRWHRGRPG